MQHRALVQGYRISFYYLHYLQQLFQVYDMESGNHGYHNSVPHLKDGIMEKLWFPLARNLDTEEMKRNKEKQIHKETLHTMKIKVMSSLPLTENDKVFSKFHFFIALKLCEIHL